MAHTILGRALALALGALACVGAAAQVQPDTQSVKVRGVKDPSYWKRAESPHLVVYADSGGDDVRRLVNHLERLDHVMRVFLRDYIHVPATAQKLTLYYPERTGDFGTVATDPPRKAIGLYESCTAGVQGFGVSFEPVSEPKNEELAKLPLRESESYIFEAYARHFIYRHTDIRAPSQLIDGLAQFFAATRFSATQTVLGRTPPAIERYLAFLGDGHRYSLLYRAVLDHPDWQATGYAGSGYAGPEGVALEYQAKSWLLTHYMLSTAERRKQMADYLNLVHDDTPTIAAFEKTFGMKIDELDYAMFRYWHKDAHVVQVDFPMPPAIPISVDTLTRAAGEVVLASAALKSCPDRKTGEALLKQLTEQSGNASANEFVLLTLSRAQIEWGNPNEAVGPLTALLRARPNHVEALQLLGMAHLRLAANANEADRGTHLAAARHYLAQARASDPASSEAAWELFRAELDSEAQPTPLALASAIAANDNAPEVPGYARAAALAYAYTGKADETETVLSALAQNTADTQSAVWARDWRQRLAHGVGRAELVAELRRTPATRPAREWTIAVSDVMRNIACKVNVENGRAFIENPWYRDFLKDVKKIPPHEIDAIMPNLERGCQP
jgi:tetratricopeptide (TPR) repeat protein